MTYVPIFLKSADQHVLVVGSGTAAIAKTALMLSMDTKITLVGSGCAEAANIAGIIPDNRTQIIDRGFIPDDLNGKTIVYIDGINHLIHRRAHKLALEKNIPVNVIDNIAKSTFTTPAQFRRGPLQIAISSGGTAPVFTRRIRALLEQIISPTLGKLANAAGVARSTVKSEIKDPSARRQFWDDLFDDKHLFADKDENEILNEILNRIRKEAATSEGLVQLVGAGPGDPDLLTLKAHRALQQADVILFDRLVSEDVLNLGRRDAVRIYVGKREGDHGIGQSRIHELMIMHAKKGLKVVRLKSGDPLTFARAGEELAALASADIKTEVIPGITALAASAASAQIPLTDRDYADTLTLATGHTKTGNYRDFARLAGSGRTLGIYMGIKNAANIASGLIAEGVGAGTPVAIIENASRRNERRLYGTLSVLPDLVAAERVQSPALILIGETIRQSRDWSLSQQKATTIAAVKG